MSVPHKRRRRPLETRLALCALLLPIAGTGCDRLPAPAVTRIRQGHRAYRQGDYARAQRLLSPVIAAHADQPDVGEAYYVRGLARLRAGQTKAAANDFQAALRVADRSELKALLHAQLGNLAFEDGQYGSAARHYRRAAPDLPNRSPTDRVLLRYGVSLQRAGRFRQAKLVLADLLTRFSSGSAAAEAHRKLAWIGDHYSIQCGVYSNQANAQATARKLRAQGLEASAWRETHNGSTRYVVRAGRYTRRADAERALPNVRRIIPDAFVVP